MGEWLSRQPQSDSPVSATPATVSPAALFLIYVGSKLIISSDKKGELQLLVDRGCSSHMVDPATILNAEQHLRKYEDLRSLQIVGGAGSHEMLATER